MLHEYQKKAIEEIIERAKSGDYAIYPPVAAGKLELSRKYREVTDRLHRSTGATGFDGESSDGLGVGTRQS